MGDVEPVFGNIKYNKNFKIFLLKGIHKTEIEWELLCVVTTQRKIQLRAEKNAHLTSKFF
jgi:hypothetical protein